MKVPDKLYFNVCDKTVLDIYSTKESDDEVEYAYINAFIEKATSWLREQEEMIGISFQDDFIERFKNYMKED